MYAGHLGFDLVAGAPATREPAAGVMSSTSKQPGHALPMRASLPASTSDPPARLSPEVLWLGPT